MAQPKIIKWLAYNIDQTLNPQWSSNISPAKVSYGDAYCMDFGENRPQFLLLHIVNASAISPQPYRSWEWRTHGRCSLLLFILVLVKTAYLSGTMHKCIEVWALSSHRHIAGHSQQCCWYACLIFNSHNCYSIDVPSSVIAIHYICATSPTIFRQGDLVRDSIMQWWSVAINTLHGVFGHISVV